MVSSQNEGQMSSGAKRSSESKESPDQDFGSEIAKAFNLQGLPQTFFIAKNGEINGVIVGELIPPELEEKLDELLAEPYP